MKEFIKKKYNVLIPIALLLVILIALLLYGREYKINRYASKTDVEVYQYFSGYKMEYTTSIGRNKKDVILSYEPKDFAINLDSTPIYLKEGNAVIFPKEMDMIFPLKDKEYRVDALSEIYIKNNLYYLNIKNLNKQFDHFFLYDGRDLYFFIDEVTFKVGDEEIKLSPMSYISCSYGNLLEYYDKENDKYGKIDLTTEFIKVTNDYMTIDITTDKVIYKDSFTILAQDFSYLAKISDTEKKGSLSNSVGE